MFPYSRQILILMIYKSKKYVFYLFYERALKVLQLDAHNDKLVQTF